MFGNLFGKNRDEGAPDLLPAIERAVSAVEPLLKQIGGYPGDYRRPVATALEYARALAASVPGPVTVNPESYAKDAFVHVIFPDVDSIGEAICSSLALQEYLRGLPAVDELYALMGMRRLEKSIAGMELSGQTVQRDVVQRVVYFTSHTLENPASSEQEARERVAASFFGSLVRKVKKRVEERKLRNQSQQLEKDMLIARLHAASPRERPALEEKLKRMLGSVQLPINSLERGNYLDDFRAVLLNPQQYLRLDQRAILLDSMGVRREGDEASRGEEFVFRDLIGYDRRDWTVTIVRCSNLRNESFAERLDKAYRRLAL